MSASVVTVIHDSADVVGDCVASVPGEYEMIVVDNASSDDGAEVARSRRSDVRIVAAPNHGFGAGCNAGARVAANPVLIFLNPDARAAAGSLERLTEMAAAEPGSIFGPAICDSDGAVRANARRRSDPLRDAAELLPAAARWLPSALRRDLPANHPVYGAGGEVDYLQGACMAVSSARFSSLGGFDETFFLYSEEEDLCDRIREAGGRCVYEPRAEVAHAIGTSTAKIGAGAMYHLFRSRVLLYRKRGEGQGRRAARLLSAAIRASTGFAPGQRRAALDGVRSGATDPLREPVPWSA